MTIWHHAIASGRPVIGVNSLSSFVMRGVHSLEMRLHFPFKHQYRPFCASMTRFLLYQWYPSSIPIISLRRQRDVKVLSIGGIAVDPTIDLGKYQFRRNLDSHFLTIANIQGGDSGQYKCSNIVQVSTNAQILSRSVQMLKMSRSVQMLKYGRG